MFLCLTQNGLFFFFSNKKNKKTFWDRWYPAFFPKFSPQSRVQFDSECFFLLDYLCLNLVFQHFFQNLVHSPLQSGVHSLESSFYTIPSYLTVEQETAGEGIVYNWKIIWNMALLISAEKLIVYTQIIAI